MIDTHCHLNSNAYSKDRDEVIKSAFAEGMEYIIVPTAEPKDFNKTVKLTQQYEKIYCSIGVHPHNANEVNEKVLEDIRKFATNNKVVAVGEIGLDYYHNHSPKDVQHFAFEQQLKIAQELNLPIIIHNRDSDEDMITVLDKYFSSTTCHTALDAVSPDTNDNARGLRNKPAMTGNMENIGVFHCYSSNNLNTLNKVLEKGFYVSFTANITFPKVNLDEVILNVPMEKLLLETDSPWMTPPPNRGKRNVPQTVKVVAEKISKVKNISIEEVIKMTNANAKKLFGLSLCLVLFIFGSLFETNQLYAQTNTNQGFYDDWDDDWDDFPDIYVRRLGFGPLLISNTFVDRYTTGARSFSHDGIFAVGGLVNYRLFESVILQATYTYAKNNNFVNRMPDTVKDWIDPNYHRAVELSVIGMFQPRQKVNFYGAMGMTYFMNQLSRNFGTSVADKVYIDDNKLGMNAGVGIFINFNLGNAGTLVINGEWRIGFRLDKTELNYDPRHAPGSENYYKPSVYNQMSSMPRGGLIWYLPFLK